MKTVVEKAKEIACLVQDGKGKDVVLLDISEINSWTDFFVIATVTSSAQQQGLQRDIADYAKANDLEMLLKNRKLSDGDDWNLIDLGTIVIHLMSDEARKFYDLEKLWHNGKQLAIQN